MRKILMQLWEQCNHKCDFCFQNGHFTDKNKIENVQKAIDILSMPDINQVETINLMGGELFDFKWSDELTNIMYKLFDRLKELLKDNLRHIYLMTNFIYNPEQLDMILESLSDIKDKISFCTSWDYEGRFKNEKDKKFFFDNVQRYSGLGYDVFCSVTLTEALMNAVVNEDYDMKYLDTAFKGKLSYHTPHGELFSDKKFDLKNFYPTRDMFFQFVVKMDTLKQLDNRKFLNPAYYPDTYFYLKDNDYIRVNGTTLNIGSYSDSNKKMKEDYNLLKESFDYAD